MQGFQPLSRQRSSILIRNLDIGWVLFRLFCNSVLSYDRLFHFSIFILSQPCSQMPENLNCAATESWFHARPGWVGVGLGTGQSIKVIPTSRILYFCEEMLCLLKALMQIRKRNFNNIFCFAQGISFLWMFAYLYLRNAGWKLAIQAYVKSYNCAWFSPTITPFSS